MNERPPLSFACVCEDRPEWFNRVFTLATSLRNLGGRAALAPFQAMFVGSMDATYTVPLAGLGAISSVVEPWACTMPQANKLRMLEAAEVADDGVLVALDCDVAIMRDVSSGASRTAVRAVPAWSSPMRPERWSELIASTGLEPSAVATTMTGTGEQIPAPFMSSAVLLIPANFTGPLLASWADLIARLDKPGSELADAERPRVEEICLALALLDTRVPVQPLSKEWDFPVQARLSDAGPSPDGPVYIVHCHGGVNEAGLLDAPGYASLAPEVDRLNAIVSARRALPVDAVSAQAPLPAGLKPVVTLAAKMVRQGRRALKR